MSFFTGFKKGMRAFGELINHIINFVLLTTVYLIGVGITWVIAKIFRKKFLQTKLTGKSYWTKLDLGKRPQEEYYRQF